MTLFLTEIRIDAREGVLSLAPHRIVAAADQPAEACAERLQGAQGQQAEQAQQAVDDPDIPAHAEGDDENTGL